MSPVILDIFIINWVEQQIFTKPERQVIKDTNLINITNIITKNMSNILNEALHLFFFYEQFIHKTGIYFYDTNQHLHIKDMKCLKLTQIMVTSLYNTVALFMGYKNRVMTIKGNMYENKKYICFDGMK